MFLALLACAAQWAGGQPAPSRDVSEKIVDRIGVILRWAAFVPDVDFSNWRQVAERHDKDLRAAGTARDYAEQLTLALDDYGVSHIGVAAPGEAMGMPAQIFGFDSVEMNGRWVVTRVFSGTDAEQAGLHAGLVLESKVQLDDNSIVLSFFDDARILRAKVIHRATTVPKIEPVLISVDKLGDVLQLSEFGEGYNRALVDSLMQKAAKVLYLVLDLRGNVGGYPSNGADLLGYFLPPGTRFGAVISKDSLLNYTRGNANTPAGRAAAVQRISVPDALTTTPVSVRFAGHIAVLIDGGTRSTGEVAATALRDYAGAKIFGMPSAGQVLEMISEDLPGGYTLYFPLRDYWTAKGERIEGHPIIPDILAQPGSEEASPVRIPLCIQALRWLHLTYPDSRS
jgi:hypothetical protein